MDKPQPTTPTLKANRTWEHLEDFVREHVQQFIQALLEEEVTESEYRPQAGGLLSRAP